MALRESGWKPRGRGGPPVSVPAFTPSAPQQRSRSAFPEIDCLRERLPLGVIAFAERRAIEIGLGADRILISAGMIDEDAYARALADWLGLAYESFALCRRESCPLNDATLVEAAKTGLIPLVIDHEIVLVIAPRSVRQFVQYMAQHPQVRFRLACTERLNDFVVRNSGNALGSRAADALHRTWPHLSAATSNRGLGVAVAVVLALVAGALIAFPPEASETLGASFAAGFIAWLGLRLLGSCRRHPSRTPQYRSESDLPIYTIIAAVYREAESIEALVDSLGRFDYPPEKLDLKIVIEPDDAETAAALAAIKTGPRLEIITAPAHGPRTKPKALNAALPFARGTFTVIYDAEDRPEPDQLRRAVDAFEEEGDDVGCVQASLTIDNTDDGWFARIFTAEYAAQFDLFLPGLAAMRLPLPLGGSSNHFRTDVLRQVGAWDSYNVTEDADLRTRLARFGYRSAVIASTTYEEAPTHFGPWLRQRTRWFKGWMQTWAVHMHNPRRLLRELGPAGFMTFQLVVGGNVLSALVHPIFLATIGYDVAVGRPLLNFDNPSDTALTILYVTALLGGYMTSFVLGMSGLAKRGLLRHASSLTLVPIHWVLLSIAAWRALYQFVRDPYRWEKTEHGLAHSSRLAKITSTAKLRAIFDGHKRR